MTGKLLVCPFVFHCFRSPLFQFLSEKDQKRKLVRTPAVVTAVNHSGLSCLCQEYFPGKHISLLSLPLWADGRKHMAVTVHSVLTSTGGSYFSEIECDWWWYDPRCCSGGPVACPRGLVGLMSVWSVSSWAAAGQRKFVCQCDWTWRQGVKPALCTNIWILPAGLQIWSF